MSAFESIRVEEWLARKRHRRWYRLSAGNGAKGPRLFDWAGWKMNAEVKDGLAGMDHGQTLSCSLLRRHHQAVAKVCHYQRRLAASSP
jgi:hypothetical protein